VKESALPLALAQINPTVGDLRGNAERILAAAARAHAEGAAVVVLPELAICGYPPEDLLLRPRFLQDCRAALGTVLHGAPPGIAVIVGFPEAAGGRVHNAAAVLAGGRLAGVYRKRELPNYGVFDEKRYFAPGTAGLVLDLPPARVLVTICEDIWIPGNDTERHAAVHQPDLVVNLSASPFHVAKQAERHGVLAAFAGRALAPVAYANLVGGQDELVFDGGSMLVAPGGATTASAKRFEEDLLRVDVPLRGAAHPPVQAEGQAASTHVVLEPFGAARTAPAPRPPSPPLGGVEEAYCALVLGTGDYARKNGFRKVVVGLSGGIDSALTAAVAVEALGADSVVGVTMPSRYNARETRADALLLAGHLGIACLTVPIEPVFAAYRQALAGPLGDGPPGVEMENLQARIRGNILMALSNRHGWLVLTTGNKSETAVGYCTLYGDMAGGFAVLKDVPKTLVYELAAHVNEAAGRELIPGTIIERPPSAELRPDQKDEDSLPPYPVLDPILEAYVEGDRQPGEILLGGIAPETIREAARLVDRNEYKRRQAPPGVRITPKAFGRDRRLPITNGYGRG
jgi:NAD+ synthase (glutamine-hydrolysing)